MLAFVLAVKNVKQRRDVDFRLNYHVKQVTKEEFESQKVETTAQELDKLKASSEFQRMAMTKGQTVENWNWQAKESKFGEAPAPRKSPIKALKSVDEDDELLMEKALIQADQELNQENSFMSLTSSALKKRRFNSHVTKSAKTQDTEDKLTRDFESDWESSEW